MSPLRGCGDILGMLVSPRLEGVKKSDKAGCRGALSALTSLKTEDRRSETAATARPVHTFLRRGLHDRTRYAGFSVSTPGVHTKLLGGDHEVQSTQFNL